MPKKRRKLSPELENAIASAKRKVELITAIINDIEEEDIQIEYKTAFQPAQNAYLYLTTLYDSVGLNEESEACHKIYLELLNKFESEYEI